MTTNLKIPAVTLNDGVEIPQLGLGVFQVPPEDTFENVTTALELGYRHIDTAAAYENEAGVGQALRTSGLDREDVFITTKLFNTDHATEQAWAALRSSLDRLELDYVDLYLIHWPVPSQDLYPEAWKVLIEAREQGLVRSIGVSNFQPAHLARIVEETGVTPSVNQVELHPLFQQTGLRREHADRGIATEAWSPLAQGAALDRPEITEIAEQHGKTAGQVVIRWHLQLGNIVFPKSVTPERIRQNIEVFDFELSGEQMDAIAALDAGERTGPDPDRFTRP
jgi:2,5-diketo-D-gluconate reductase A